MDKSYTKLSWQKYEADIEQLAKRLKGQKFDWIVAISRGGLVPARILSDLLGLPISHITIEAYKNLRQEKAPIITELPSRSFNNESILIVDEIVDTGKTLIRAMKYFKRFPRIKIKTLSPYVKSYSEYMPDYFVEKNDNWVIFPYEKKETISAFGKIYKTKQSAKKRLLEIGFTDSEVEDYLA